MWQPIETAPKDGSYIFLSDGFFMRICFWQVNTNNPSHEQWADMARAEAHEATGLQWTPKYWMPLPAPPGGA